MQSPNGTVALGANLAFGGITLTAPGVPITISAGNTLTNNGPIDMSTATADLTLNCDLALGAANTWTVNSSRTLTVGGIISGANGTTKLGAGTATLSGANTYSGDTTISVGTLKLDAGGTLANTPNITVASGATFDVSTPTTALTLGATQTLKATATGGNTTATIKVASGKNLTLGGFTAGVGLAFTAYGGGATAPLTVDGTAGSLALNAKPITVTTTTPLAAGTYKLIAKSGAGATVTGTIGTLTVNGSGVAIGMTPTLQVISGELFLIVPGDLFWDIDGSTVGAGGATPSGTWATSGTNWSTGILGDVATTAYTTLATDNLAFSAGTDATGSYAITLGANQNAKSLTFEDGTATISANTATLGGGGGITVLPTAGNPIISSGLTIAGGNTFNVDSGRTLTLQTGTFTRGTRAALNVQGAGTVTSTQSGLATATVTANNGIFGPWASYGTGASTKYATLSGNNIIGLTGTGAATPDLVTNTAGTQNIDLAGVGSGSTALFGTGASINTLRYTGAVGTIGVNTLLAKGVMNAGSGTLTLSGAVSAGSSANELVVNTASGNITMSTSTGKLTGSINKTGSGTLTLGNGADHSFGAITVNEGVLVTGGTSGDLLPGATINSGGTLRWGSSSKHATTAAFVINAGGTLDCGALDDGVGAVTGAGNIIGTTGRLQIGGSGTFSGVISGSGMRILVFNGAFATNTGLNTYGGITTIGSGASAKLVINSITNVNGGASAVGNPTDAASGTISIGGGPIGNYGILSYIGTGNTSDRVINLNGNGCPITLDQSGASGLLKFTSAFTATGIGSKILNLTGSTAGTGEIGGAIVDNSTTGTTVSTAASTASTALVLASVDGLTVGNAISGTGITGGTTISAINTSTKTVTLSAAATVASGATITSAGLVNLTSLTKSGTGTWTLSGVNTYSGDTTISGGTLKLDAGGTLANTPNITVASGATFDVSTPTTALTLGAGQTLKASATGGNTTATITVASGKNLTLGGTTTGLAFTAYGGGATAPLTVAGASAGALDLNGKPVTVTTTTALLGGTYKLIAKSGSATVMGTPGTLTVNGSAQPAGATASLQVISGELWLNVVGLISYTGTPTAFTTTYGTASAAQSFPVTGSGLTANLVATAPTGFEVSSDGTTYGSTATFTTTAGSASGTLRIRLAASATVSGAYDSQNIVLSGTGANSVNITTLSSGNTVSTASPTVTVTVGSYTYNGSPQGPTTYTTNPTGDTGTPTWSYVGTGVTTYGPSATQPTAAGTYTATVSLAADSNFNAANSSATAFTIGRAIGANAYWIQNSADNWATANDWDGGVLPDVGSLATFTNATATFAPSLAANTSVGALVFSNATTFGAGTGILSLSNASPGGVGIFVDSGAGAVDLGGAKIALLASQTWQNNSASTLTVGGVISGAGFGINKTGTGPLTLSGTNTYSGPTTNSAGTLTIGGAGKLGNGTYATNIVNDGIFNYNSSAAQTLSGIISGTGTLNYLGAGQLNLNGTNTFSGGITITAGTIVPGNTNAIGTGTLTVNSGGKFYPVKTLTFTNAVTLNGGTLEIGGANGNVLEHRGLVTVTANSAMTADGSTYGIYLNGGVDMGSGGYTLSSFNSGTASQIYGIVGANGTIMNTGPGILYIQGTNTFAGTFRASSGTISFLNAYALTNATLDMNAADAGTVSLNNNNAIIGALTGSRNLALGSGNVSIGNNGLSTVYSGGLSGNGSLNKIGIGTLTLSGTNTYSGATTISAGTLALGAGGSLASPVISVAGGAAFDVSAASFTLGSGQILSNSASATASLVGPLSSGSGTISVSFVNGTPAFNVTGGPLNLSAATVVVVRNTGSTLTPGTYKIISASGGGSVSGTAPTAVSVLNGPAAGTPSASIIGGELYLTVGATTNFSYGSTSFTYTNAAQAPAISYSGSAGTKTTNYVGTGVTTYSSLNAPTNVGTYYVSNTVAADANYFGATNSQSFTINAAALGIMANNASKNYGQTVTFVGTEFTASGLMAGDSVTNVTLTSAGATNTAVVGGYAIVASAAVGSGLSNYTISYTTGTLTVTTASTSVGASSTNNPSGFRDAVAFLATLPADATGSVVFASTNGPISTNAVSSGSATSLSITNLPRGTNAITVAYLGDSNYFGSTNSLNQIVTNHPPTAANASYTRNAVVNTFKIAVTNLLANASDADADSLALASVGATTNGATVMLAGGYVLYFNTNAVADEFTYTVTDGFGGTNSATTTINVDSTPVFGQSQIVDTSGGTATLNFAGIPGFSYSIARSTNLVNWAAIWTTNAPAGGMFQFIDLNAPISGAFYRLQYNP